MRRVHLYCFGTSVLVLMLFGCASVEKQYQNAVDSRNENKIRKFIQSHPESPLIMDAAVVLDTVKYESAIADTGTAALEEFLRKYPTNPLAPQASQELARRIRDRELEILRAQLREEKTPDLLIELADIHLNREEYEDADSLYNEAIIMEPNLASAHTGLAMVYLERGMTVEADEEIDLALDLSPANPRVQFAAGEYYKRIGRPDLAINAFQRVLNNDFDNVEAHLQLGIIYLDAGQNKNAVYEFRQVQTLDPTNVPSLYYLGVAYADQGDAVTAIRYLDDYLRAPHSEEDVENIDKARSLVEQLKAGRGDTISGGGRVVADPNNPQPQTQPKPDRKPQGQNRNPTGFGRNPWFRGGARGGAVGARSSR